MAPFKKIIEDHRKKNWLYTIDDMTWIIFNKIIKAIDLINGAQILIIIFTFAWINKLIYIIDR